MKVIQVRNVHDALILGLEHLEKEGISRPSRYGDVIVSPTPVMTVYSNPQECVLFHSARDANPFFHLMESLHMLAGKNDVEWLAFFNERMREFSDDGKIFHGAYGYRWQKHFNINQLDIVIKLLQRDPNSRRAVIQMWDCKVDLFCDEVKRKDIPCNDLIFVQLIDGSIHISVMCRSNDVILGAYGANAVHFSILQQYLQGRINPNGTVGPMYQFSNNFHAYIELYEKLSTSLDLKGDGRYYKILNPYLTGTVKPVKLVTNPAAFNSDLNMFMSMRHTLDDSKKYGNAFFPKVAVPMMDAYIKWKTNKGSIERYTKSMRIIQQALQVQTYCDWLIAGFEWLERRRIRFIEKKKEVGTIT